MRFPRFKSFKSVRVVGTLGSIVGCLFFSIQPNGAENEVGEQPQNVAVNPFKTVESFPEVSAKYLRFNIAKANGREPSLDEVEVFSADVPSRNVALVADGARINASGEIGSSGAYTANMIGDSQFGRNSRWVADQESDVWIEIEFAHEERINRVVWSRDRTGQHWDRTPIDYQIETSPDQEQWVSVANSKNRAPGLVFESVTLPKSRESGPNSEVPSRRPPINTYRNVETFPPVSARYIRFVILDSLGQRITLDELEVYSTEDGGMGNIALATNGASATCSNGPDLVGDEFNAERLIDGRFGDALSWRGYELTGGWIEIALPRVFEIDRLVWSRDREGQWFDGTPARYRIDLATSPNDWTVVAHSDERESSQVLDFIDQASAASDYVIDAWPEDDNLPLSSINAFAQTPDGYLWIGTDNGLLRFDGNEFYRFDRSNTPALSTSKITRLYVDHQGRMWIMNRKYFYDSNNNVVLFDRGQFSRIELPQGHRMTSVIEEEDGQVWLVTDQAAIPWRDGTLAVHDALNGYTAATAEYVDPADPVGKRRRWTSRPGRWSHGEFIPSFGIGGPVLPHHGELGRRIQFARRDGGAWILHGGLGGKKSSKPNRWRLLSTNGILTPSKPFPWISERSNHDAVLVDRSDNLWIADSRSGLKCFFADGERYQSLGHLAGLGPGGVRRMFEDRTGDLWLGGGEAGLLRLRRRLFHSIGAAQGMVTRSLSAQPDNVYSVSPAGANGVWIGTHASNAYRWQDGQLTHLWNSSGATWAVMEDSRGILWTGAYGRGARRQEGMRVSVLPTVGSYPLAFLEDRLGRIWTGGDFGLSYLDQDTLHRLVPPNFAKASFEWVISLTESKDGALWVGTKLGFLHRYKEGSFETIWKAEKGSEFPVCAIYQDPSEAIWFTRFGYGLSRYQNGTIKHFTERDGLPSSTINGMLVDQKGTLWMTSKKGVFRISEEEFQRFGEGKLSRFRWQQFTESDGLPSNLCNGEQTQPSLCQTEDGRIWIPTFKGVGVIDPARVEEYGEVPQVVIQEVTLFNGDGTSVELLSEQRLKERHPGNIPELVIPPGNRSLMIRYTSIEFSEAEQVRFKYRIVGLEDDWLDAKNERAALIASLGHGVYRFELQAENHLGRSSEIASLALSVQPFWWETLGFRVFAGAFFLVAAVWGYQKRVQQLERRNQLQEEFSRQLIEREEGERKRIAQELHDGLGHELLMVRNRALDGSQAPADKAGERFADISEMAGRALENARSMAYNLRPFELDRIGFKNAVESMIAKLSDSSEIRFFKDIDDLEAALPSSALVSLYRLVQEGLNNVLKHSNASMVLLEIKVEEGGVRFQLEDDGAGFDTSKRTGGMGLSGMEERVHLIKGRFQLSSTPGKGTRLRIRIPI